MVEIVVSVGPAGNVKNAFAIVAAVAGYSLLETALLFSLISPRAAYSPTGFQMLVAFAQILLIPGMAAVISWAMNGSHRWTSRTFRILLGGVLTIPAALVFLLIMVAVLLPLVWSYDVSRTLFAVLFLAETAALVFALLFLVRKSGRWGVAREAERWLAERQARANPHERTWRNRAVKFAVGIPVLSVLPIFLFLPETMGLMSHLLRPQVSHLPGYKVRIPLTWMATDHWDSPDGSSLTTGIAGQGIARGRNPARARSISNWSFGTGPYNQSDTNPLRDIPGDYKIISQRLLKIGNEEVTCTDYHYTSPYDASEFPLHSTARVSCAGRGRLHASMFGNRDELPAFYEVLSGITPTK